MAITLDKLVKHCEALELPFRINTEDGEPYIILQFDTNSYLDVDGDHCAMIFCQARIKGEYLAVIAPEAFHSKDCKFKGALFAALAEISAKTKYVQLTHEPDSGTISFEVEIPVMDGTVTAKQLNMMVMSVLLHLERYYPVIKHVMDTGKIDFDLMWVPEESA